MPETVPPHQILRDLLQRNAPERPLFVPIAFSMAARLENLALPAFLTNPTKISNALRQIRGPLRCDAVTCYFDPMLETDAIRVTDSIEMKSEDEQASPQDAAERGRVPIAVDVIRRMKGLLRDESLLAAGVSGPLTLTARASLAESDHDYAVSVVTEIARVFAEFGANLIFICEGADLLPDIESIESWKSALVPIFNIVRFYEALPVVRIGSGKSSDKLNARTAHAILKSAEDCVVCLPLAVLRNMPADALADISGINLGISLPVEAFESGPAGADAFDRMLVNTIRSFQPAIVTSGADLPMTTDPKRVAALAEIVRNAR